MTAIIMNPGSGSCREATTYKQARKNLGWFLRDLQQCPWLQDGPTIKATYVPIGKKGWEHGPYGNYGKYTWKLARGLAMTMLEIPGLSLEKVRYLDDRKCDTYGNDNRDHPWPIERKGVYTDNIWHVMRCYVDGSSWAWPFALAQTASALRDWDESIKKERKRRDRAANKAFVERCTVPGCANPCHIASKTDPDDDDLEIPSVCCFVYGPPRNSSWRSQISVHTLWTYETKKMQATP